MSSLLEHCHGEKTHFSRNEKRTFSLSQMNNVELARTLPWRENALFEEREKNVFVKPNEQCRACSNIAMARKRTFRGTRKEWFSLSQMNDAELAQTLPWRENALLEEREKKG